MPPSADEEFAALRLRGRRRRREDPETIDRWRGLLISTEVGCDMQSGPGSCAIDAPGAHEGVSAATRNPTSASAIDIRAAITVFCVAMTRIFNFGASASARPRFVAVGNERTGVQLPRFIACSTERCEPNNLRDDWP